MLKNIFILGIDDFNLGLLKKVRRAEQYRFHGLLERGELTYAPRFDVPALLEKAYRQLDAFEGTIDAIVAYWDFPSVMMLPVIRKRYGLPGPSLESVMRCEHKYWARRIQQETVPEATPEFRLLDTCDAASLAAFDMPYPFWMKPVKAHSSILGFRVRNDDDFRQAIDRTRAAVHRFAEPLNALMEMADVPDEIRRAHGGTSIVEAIISAGRQCTLEGYVRGGQVVVYGVVDSIRGPNRSSFERYQYPSELPRRIQGRMIELATRFIGATGLDDSPFNIEFFWEQRGDHVWLLEVNARISRSHSPLFDKVDGSPHKEVMIEVALGHQPDFPRRAGRFRRAAKFMPRHYGHAPDAMVTDCASPAEVREIEARVPGTEIEMHVRPGMRLDEGNNFDSYSVQLATIFIGASSQKKLMRSYRTVLDALHIEVEERAHE